uniref:Secreted protein n=1 Tax=Macrostomum lignano TaxID=282301 RepID=A0A1I8FNE9_9PLAT
MALGGLWHQGQLSAADGTASAPPEAATSSAVCQVFAEQIDEKNSSKPLPSCRSGIRTAAQVLADRVRINRMHAGREITCMWPGLRLSVLSGDPDGMVSSTSMAD